MSIYVKCIAKPFSDERRSNYKFKIRPDGVVHVWDSVLAYYTTCHNLSPRSLQRIRQAAANV